MKNSKLVSRIETWDLVPPPPDANIVSSRWVYKIKDENPPRYKARFCPRGFSQQYGVDYEETFAPVVKPETLRVLFAVSAARNYDIHQMDVKTAFLNSTVKEDIYVRQPEGYVDRKYPNHVCKVNKAMYGLKQSANEWYETIKGRLESPDLEFKRLESDHAVFMIRNELSTVYLAIYVDDIAIFGDDKALISDIKAKLSSTFEMKDLGLAKRFIGLDITRNSDGDVIVSQEHYLRRCLERFGMQDAKPVYTPMDPSLKLRKRQDGDNSTDATLYREIIGSFNHAAIYSRPEIAFAISKLSQFMSDPSDTHMAAAKHFMRYIVGTIALRQVYSANKPLKLECFSDASWSDDLDDSKSHSGYANFLNGASISYSSKKQTLVAMSSMEAESVALSHAAKEVLWLRQLCHDLNIFGGAISSPITPTILTDSRSALDAIKNPVHHARTKHFGRHHHFIRDCVAKGEVSTGYIPSADNPADVFTKALNRVKHASALRLLNMA